MNAQTSTGLRWTNRVAAVLFLISAALQLNDPDPVFWFAIYAGAAVACLAWDRVSPPWLLPALVGTAALIWAALLAPSALPDLRLPDLVKKMEDKTPAIELGREMLGLVFIAAWMALLGAVTARAPRRQ